MSTTVQYVLTLVYPNSTKFIVGGFSTMQALSAWVTNAKTEPGWVAGTTTDIQTITLTAP